MSEQESARLSAVENKLDDVYTAIAGNSALGVTGISKMLQNHMDDSKANHAALLQEFKVFKRDIVHDYARDFVRVDEAGKETNNRVSKLEEFKTSQNRTMGIFGGVMFFFGVVISYLKSILFP